LNNKQAAVSYAAPRAAAAATGMRRASEKQRLFALWKALFKGLA